MIWRVNQVKVLNKTMNTFYLNSQMVVILCCDFVVIVMDVGELTITHIILNILKRPCEHMCAKKT